MAQKQSIIYINPEEELTHVRERLEAVSGQDIILVVPATTTLRSHIGWRLLQARARELGKNVLIVTADRQIRATAKAAGFTVAAPGDPSNLGAPSRRNPANS